MAIIRAPLRYLGGGKGRVAQQTKYGKRKGNKPAGRINVIRSARRK